MCGSRHAFSQQDLDLKPTQQMARVSPYTVVNYTKELRVCGHVFKSSRRRNREDGSVLYVGIVLKNDTLNGPERYHPENIEYAEVDVAADNRSRTLRFGTTKKTEQAGRFSRVQFAAKHIDLQPTQQMADNAARGLELREKHGKGGTAVGVARARDIKNRANLSPETVKRMHSFFSRHEGNQAGGEDDAGYIAWMLWGGDAGKAWAARKAAQIDKNESARRAARKSTMARNRDVKVRKGNFTDTVAIVGQNGGDSADWYAGLILRHKDGEEQVLWMKHNYKTEAAATKYAIQKFDAHVGRGGYSRPGKAAFSNGERNRRMMQVLADADRRIANQVVSNIAAHYGIPTQQVFDEIFDAGAENLMDYVTEPVRSAASVILQKKGMMSRPGKATMAKREYVLWALPKGETDRMHEKPIAYNITKPADMERIKVEATKRGYHSFRVQVIEWNRPGAKARFNAASAWLAKYLSKVNEWWRDHTDYPTDLDASSDRGDIEGVLDDIAEHCREAVPREARPSWYAAAVRDMQKIPHARKAHMKNHFGIDRPMNVSQTASGGGTWTTKTERYGSKKATVEFYNKGGMVGSVYQDPDNPRLYKAFSEPDGREIASGSREACKAAVEKLAMSRPGAKAAFNKPMTVTVQTLLSGTGGSGGLFKVVGYDENGREYEYGLFAMRSMAEDKAKQIARYKDWSFRASRPGAKGRFDLRAKVEKMKSMVSKLAATLGFKPDEVTGNDQMMHILFENQPKQAERLAAALRTNLARVGVPGSAITADEHHYADDNTTYGGVWIDLHALANASGKMSRPGAKAAFADYGSFHPTAPWTPNPQGNHRYKKGDRVVSHEGRNPKTGVIDRLMRDAHGYPTYVLYWDEGGTREVADVHLTKMSRPGAKARFGGMRNMTNGPYTLHYTASGLYGEPTWRLIDKNGKPTNAVEHDEANAREMLRKANAGEAVYISSRPGAKAAMSRPGEAEAFAIGATSDSADPAKDEALTALAAQVGREHTINLFKRWSEGKASMNRS